MITVGNHVPCSDFNRLNHTVGLLLIRNRRKWARCSTYSPPLFNFLEQKYCWNGINRWALPITSESRDYPQWWWWVEHLTCLRRLLNHRPKVWLHLLNCELGTNVMVQSDGLLWTNSIFMGSTYIVESVWTRLKKMYGNKNCSNTLNT
jgi:hypothetical protein